MTTLDAYLQLAHSKVPVRSLTVLEPPTADADELVYSGIWEYIRYKPEAVSRVVRLLHCKHRQTSCSRQDGDGKNVYSASNHLLVLQQGS